MKSITISQTTVFTTEEFIELKSATERAGGRIAETHAIRNGQGIACILEMPAENRYDM
ncbi:hypothetical protein KM915_10310 [Cytobacillus oceanisediminis]|uniref:hypothetical protein n=1 Tax=Cytobacillus oceanisediminis TaxID=665099 RepID=UPI001C23B554|nr:hypothetical protein [Cytobacillus oceanisediminis]MBU8730446.1 hypothetical protein [Cytobacillus oceanisediminis]